MNEVTDVLVGIDLIFIIRNWSGFWLVFINPCFPDLIISLDLILKFFEEHGMFIGKLVFGQCFQVKPLGLLHPWEDLIRVINTSTHFEEKTNITLVEFAILDKDLRAHHKFECYLITLEQTSVDIPIDFIGKTLGNVMHSVLDEVRFR